MAFTIATDELLRRLIKARHHLPGEDPSAYLTDVWSTPDKIVTVALHLDPTLKEEYRQRYFACLLESPRHPVPIIQYEPTFSLREVFRQLAGERPMLGAFLDGPFRWLLHRLRAYDEILLWPAGRGQCSGGAFEKALASETLPKLSQWLQRLPVGLVDVGAILLDMTDLSGCGLLWEVGGWVGNSLTDFYVSDSACTEVYTLHHHEKVEVMVPDDWARHCLVEELECWDEVLEDCSGYEDDEADE
jgi:hypothetical protein